MKFSARRNYLFAALAFAIAILLLPLFLQQQSFTPKKAYAASPIQHVFIIMMENHNWSQIKGSAQAPYINNTLLPMGGHAEQYYNPPGIHPSLPNYLWLEAGTNFGILNDNDPAQEHQSTTNHLVTLLTNAGLTWKAYEENISGTTCPLTNSGEYAVRHEPFTYFDDVTNNLNPNSQNCIQHLRPFTELAAALTSNTIPNYTFITPNLIDDMHDGTIQQGDTWLSQHVPAILSSQAYINNGLVIITWDEGEGGDGPIGMIVLSPLAKKNYSNTIHYDHSSTVKTIEEIFGLSPLLGGAASATDLSDFFTTSITSGGQPQPTNITPTLFCVGGNAQPPCATIAPSGTVTAPAPTTTTTITAAPTQNPCVAIATNGTVYAFKAHKHTNGGISNLFLLLLQFLLQLLQQLLGGGTGGIPGGNQAPTATPFPTTNPSGVPTVNPISPTINPVSPTMNPCITPTIQTTAGGTMAPGQSQTVAPTNSITGQNTSERFDTDSSSLSQLASIDPTSTKWFYNTTNANVFGNAVSGYAAQPTTDYKSYATFAQDINSGKLSGVKWVVYDNENWSFTPTNEQQHPTQYMKQFADLAHQHGLHVIETPARDLMTVSGADCTTQNGESVDQAYVRCQLPATAARSSDIYEIQAQADQTSVSAYTSLVSAAKTQAVSAAPGILVEAGLTTDRGDSANVIFSCWQVTHTMVNGYWMNTGSSTVSVAAQALDKIRAAGG